MTEGLTFGTDAYLLSAYVRRRVRGRAVDLGSGTGVIALLCAHRAAFSHIHAVELQSSFCDLIARNAADNGLGDRITPVCRDVRELTVEDVGGKIKGRHIDVWFPSHAEALRWGARRLAVKVIDAPSARRRKGIGRK